MAVFFCNGIKKGLLDGKGFLPLKKVWWPGPGASQTEGDIHDTPDRWEGAHPRQEDIARLLQGSLLRIHIQHRLLHELIIQLSPVRSAGTDGYETAKQALSTEMAPRDTKRIPLGKKGLKDPDSLTPSQAKPLPISKTAGLLRITPTIVFHFMPYLIPKIWGDFAFIHWVLSLFGMFNTYYYSSH